MNTRHYFLCPVTHFAGKNLYRSDLTYEQIRRFLPVAPNVQHFDDRIPLQTIPRWNDATSYVLLQSVEVEGYKIERADSLPIASKTKSGKRILVLINDIKNDSRCQYLSRLMRSPSNSERINSISPPSSSLGMLGDQVGG